MTARDRDTSPAGPGPRHRPRRPAHRHRRERLGRDHGPAPGHLGPHRRHRGRPEAAGRPDRRGGGRRWWWWACPSPWTGPAVGPPLSASDEADALRALLEEHGVDVELFDERLTTVTAHQALAAGGTRERDRRAVVDKAAAAVMLTAWLEGRRAGRGRDGPDGPSCLPVTDPTAVGRCRPGDGAGRHRAAPGPPCLDQEPDVLAGTGPDVEPARTTDPTTDRVQPPGPDAGRRRTAIRGGSPSWSSWWSAWSHRRRGTCGSTPRRIPRARRGRRSSSRCGPAAGPDQLASDARSRKG